MYRTGTYRYFYPLLPRTPPRAKVMNFGLDFHRSLVSSLRSGRFLSFRALSSKQRRNAPGMSKKLSQFSSPSRAFGKGKETAASQANMISNIPQCSELTVLGLSFQQDCRFDKHVKGKLGKANKCLYVIRSLRKEGCNQFEVDYYLRQLFYPMLPMH